MSLNWHTFLGDDGLTLSNEQWPDISPAAGAPLQMPKSNATRSSSSDAEETNNFGSLLNGTTAGPYFDNNLFTTNDYFLSDLDVLQPFGDLIAGGGSTSESSPEPMTNMGPTDYTRNSEASRNLASTSSKSTQSPLLSSAQRQSLQRAKTFPNPSYESMFPNNLESGFVEDLTFPGGPESLNASKPSIESSMSPPGSTTVKRSKADSDILSACWTSPLCPNHDLNGQIPNSANCGGGCAPFLFASEDTLPTPTINSFPVGAQEVIAEDGVVEIQPRSRKRTESEASSNEPQGRQFPSKNTSRNNAEPKTRVKSEKLSTSPEHVEVQATDDTKPKSRRRLPHNQVERKYRESLNTQLDSLLRVVPSLQQNQPPCDGADIEDLPAPTKPSKAIILASATAYIKQMEKDKKNLADENQILRTRVKALQALIKCDDCSLMQYVMDLKINPPN
ncbi:hypothetical protein K505DRAFT_300893 [Melanomma pulvis-pyrius CBS 109.77]|uniref:BHLH domain-containing protein n=1 Tax=Melanomma pulvis-pyrius CBS 109.77 TaxID=1314802 RepID=A0A6A6XJM5_9PLEO|nr:hypothetical protein K505DRAFT_300893 [Melanomma pulvis-pyrius CBS 109.77]